MKKIYTIITLLLLLTNALSAVDHQAVSLDFDGTNDYVYLGSSAVLKPTAALTVEAVLAGYWGGAAVKSQKGDIITNTEIGGYSLEIGNAANDGAGTYIHGFVRRNGSYAHVKYDCSQISSASSKRVSIALVSNSNSVILYINGNPVNTVAASGSIQYNSSNATLIGAQAGTGSTPESSGDYFDGIIDEIRIWNIAREYADIEDYTFNEVPANQTRLVALYRFNQGIADKDNSTITALTDSKNLTNGVLKNFSLTVDFGSNFRGWNCLAPLSMVKDISITNLTNNGATVSFNRGLDIATNYAVFFKKTSSTTDLPAIENDMFWSPYYGDTSYPVDLGNGWQLIKCEYWDTGTNGLQSYNFSAPTGTDCKVVVYEYNEQRYRPVNVLVGNTSYNKTSTTQNTVYFKTLVSGIEDEKAPSTALIGNYPNPFNPVTTIKYSLADDASVSLKIFDIQGNLISELFNGNQSSGSYSVDFKAANLSSGIYFYSLTVNGKQISLKKMNLIK